MTDEAADDVRTPYERMVAGDPYIPDAPLVAANEDAIGRAARYGQLWHADRAAARSLLCELLGSVGDDVEVRPPLFVDYGAQIRIGDRTFINFNLTALDVCAITIGDDVYIGPNVQLLTPTHPTDPGVRRKKIEGGAPIRIGSNVWIGGGATILPGVSIGENTVVGAAAVVTADLPAGVVAVGSPARVVRHL